MGEHAYDYCRQTFDWLNAVKTRETLEHEVQRYGAAAGIYKDSTNRPGLLVERVAYASFFG